MARRSNAKDWAKVAGRPWSVTESLGASERRALRARRCSQERRQCARGSGQGRLRSRSREPCARKRASTVRERGYGRSRKGRPAPTLPPIQCSVSRPFFVAFVFSVMKRNFHEIASKKAIEPKLLVKPIHTLSPACSNLVAHPVGWPFQDLLTSRVPITP